MSEPLVSIIIPAYNAAAYLGRAIDSLLAQTWQRLEVLVVDDGSTDDTGIIAEEYAAGDNRVRVVHKANGGVAAARNTGLEAARGELIGFTDSDDWVRPEYVSLLVRTIMEQQADIAVCGFDEELPVPGAAPLVRGTEPRDTCGPEEAVVEFLRRDAWFTALWNKLFRRDALLRDGALLTFDESLTIGEDETWLLRLLPGVTRVAFCPVSLYCWTSRPDSVSRKEVITPRSLTVLQAKRMAMELVRPWGPKVVKLSRSRLLNDCYHLKVIAYRSRDRETLRMLRKQFRPVRWDWLTSDDVPPLRKGKVLAMDVLILLHAPTAWVDRVFMLRRQHG